jgi:hypothetical protein
MQDTHRSSLTGTTYRISTKVLCYEDPDTGANLPLYRKVEGLVDGVPLMLDSPCWAPDILKYELSMCRALIAFLEGKSHITHYRDYPEIVAAKGGTFCPTCQRVLENTDPCVICSRETAL